MRFPYDILKLTQHIINKTKTQCHQKIPSMPILPEKNNQNGRNMTEHHFNPDHPITRQKIDEHKKNRMNNPNTRSIMLYLSTKPNQCHQAWIEQIGDAELYQETYNQNNETWCGCGDETNIICPTCKQGTCQNCLVIYNDGNCRNCNEKLYQKKETT